MSWGGGTGSPFFLIIARLGLNGGGERKSEKRWESDQADPVLSFSFFSFS